MSRQWQAHRAPIRRIRHSSAMQAFRARSLCNSSSTPLDVRSRHRYVSLLQRIPASYLTCRRRFADDDTSQRGTAENAFRRSWSRPSRSLLITEASKLTLASGSETTFVFARGDVRPSREDRHRVATTLSGLPDLHRILAHSDRLVVMAHLGDILPGDQRQRDPRVCIDA